MTAALLLRHTNRTGLRYLTRTQQPDTDHGAAPIGCAQPAQRPARPRRRPTSISISTATATAAASGAVVPVATDTTSSRASGRHDLLPAGPGVAVCTDCGSVFELHAHAAAGRRLPRCPGPQTDRDPGAGDSAGSDGPRPYGEPTSPGRTRDDRDTSAPAAPRAGPGRRHPGADRGRPPDPARPGP